MSLKLKWHLRQITKAVLTAPLSLSFAIAALCAFRMIQFYKYGLTMYPTYTFPKVHNAHYELEAFWLLSLSPLVPWIVAALPVDIVIRRLGWKLYE
jgi:hypothetical protein